MTTGTKTMLGILIAAILVAVGLYAVNKPNEQIIIDEVPETMETGTTTPSTSTTTSPNPAGTVEAGSTNAQKCASQGGTWSEAHKECTGVSQNSCQEIGGTFNECASACRHNPNAEVCIMMCVQVCTLK